MFVRRTVSTLAVVLLALAMPSGNDLVRAVGQNLVSICHDGLWDPGEYCGRDARVVTGVADMNHDCFVDGLDIGLFGTQYNTAGPNLSADLNDSNHVSLVDFALFGTTIGDFATPCTSVPIPVVCDGTIALSFSSNPATIVSNTSQAPGAHTAYVVINNVTNARIVEYSLAVSSNVQIINQYALGGLSAPPCGGHSMALATPSVIASGPALVAQIDYQLTDTNPATLTIAPGPCDQSRVRWSDANTTASHNFATVVNAGINGPTPLATGCPGTISGNVYADVDYDCAFNGADYPATGRTIEVTPGPITRVTDAAGNYSFLIPSGQQYTVKLAAGVNDPWKLSDCQTSSYVVGVTPNSVSTGNDFSLEPVGYITGRVFFDFASDCVFNAFDYSLAGRVIEINPGGYLTYTNNASGDYSITLPLGNYTVSLVALPNDPWLIRPCQTATHNVTVTPNATLTANFAMYPVAPICNVAMSIHGRKVGTLVGPPPCEERFAGPCPGLEYESIFWVNNVYKSTEAIEAGRELHLTLDPVFTISSLNSNLPMSVISSPGPNERIVQLDTKLYPGQVWKVGALATPSAIGPHNIDMVFDDSAGCTGISTRSGILVKQGCPGPCDPNDLTVEPEGCGPQGNILHGTQLTYTIRFENIGQGPAHNVFIEDVIDADLDVNSLAIVSSSHTVTGLQVNPGNKLVISFDGIDLPGTYGPGDTKGYVIFTINPKPGLPEGTTVENTAEITFDFNEPVVTNTTLNTFQAVPTGCPAVCHDNIWQEGEFCGYDAYVTTGVPDMNHDCMVDGLDMGLLVLQFGMTGLDVSGDLDANGIVNGSDLSLITANHGAAIEECTSAAGIDSCKGNLALSFFEGEIVDNTAQSTGTNYAYVLMEDAGGARIVEYSIVASPNVTITAHEPRRPEIAAFTCDSGAYRTIVWSVFAIPTDGLEPVARITYELSDTGPAFLAIVPSFSACSDRNRWATSAGDRSFDFVMVTNAGINGPTPPPTPTTCQPTAVNPRDTTPRVEQLAQNYPNPFNPTTTIDYALATQRRVTISIYSVRGELVRTLVDETLPAGWHSTTWNGRDQAGSPVASGIYLYRMAAGSFVETKKLVLLK